MHQLLPPDGYVLHKEWDLWTFSPHKYARANENNSMLSAVIILPLFILMLPKVLLTDSAPTAHWTTELMRMLIATVLSWLLYKGFVKLLTGQWCRIHLSAMRLFPGWKGALTKKRVNRLCIIAPVLTLVCQFVGFYLLPSHLAGALMIAIFFMMFMLATGINLAFKLIEEPDTVLVALQGNQMRLYRPNKRE